MAAYLINILLLFVWRYMFLSEKGKDNFEAPKKKFCIIASLQWIILSGLRAWSVGADTYGYKVNHFDRVINTSWKMLLDDFVSVIFKGGEGRDPGYPILEKVFQIFCKDYQGWLIFIAVVFTVPMGIWLYKHSEDVFMSFLIYSCLFYSFFSITGHRQTIATGVVVFMCDRFIRQRKFITLLIITLLMSTVHKSCLIFIPFYFVYNKKITQRYIIVVIMAMIVCFILKDSMFKYLAETSGYEGYDVYIGAGTYTFTTFMILITLVAMWRLKSTIRMYPESIHAYNALMISLIFIPLTFVNPSAMRVVQYFSVYIMLLVPYMIKTFDEKEKHLAMFVAITVILIFFIRQSPQYAFFWEVSGLR